jgi:transposase-like protein
MSDSERRFSDDEAREIIKRALQLQHRKSEDASSPEGLSLSELESIAEDVGVSSELVRQAAAEVETGEATAGRSRFLGATTTPSETVALDRPLGEDELEELLIALPSITGDDGTGNAHRRSLSWSTNSVVSMRTGRSLRITAHGSDSGGVVRIREDLGQVAGGVFGGLIGGVGLGAGFGVGFGVGLGALGSPAFAAIVPIAFVGGSYLLARGIFRAVSRARRRQVRRVAARVREFFDRGRPAPEAD